MNTENYPVVGVLGIPGPVFNNSVSIIANLEWGTTKGDDLAEALNIIKFVLLNDFVVNGYGVLSNMKEGIDYERLNTDVVDPNGPKAMIGAGTGLGHGLLFKTDESKYYQVYPSEGGHQDFAPQNQLEWKYFEYLQKHYNITHVSVERACAGPALPVMYQFISECEKLECSLTKEEQAKITPEEIIANGLKKTCRICERVVELFTTIYGAAAGNMSLLTLPTGGLYLLGGLSVALEDYIIKQNVFRV